MPQDQRLFLQQFCHLNLVAGLALSSRAPVGGLVFQGGTSLRLMWGSPRFSEDLDYLVRKDQVDSLDALVKKVAGRLHEALAGQGFNGKVEVSPPRRRKGLAVIGYWVNYIDSCYGGEKVKVKCEFKPVTEKQIQDYHSVVRAASDPLINIMLRPMVEAAMLETILADKVMAVTARKQFKYRDFFDMWWIINQGRTSAPDARPEEFIRDMINEFSIYDWEGESFVERLESVLEELKKTPDQHVDAAAGELQLWLGQGNETNGQALHAMFLQGGVYRQMVDSVTSCLEQSRALLKEHRTQIQEALDEQNLSLCP